MGYLAGFGVTLKKIAEGVTTRNYRGGRNPNEDNKVPKTDRAHGRHVLNRYEDGMEKCIGCELCAGVCPANCIYVRGAENNPEDPKSPGERFGFVYEINYLRCIHCDLCVEACPTEAITETKLFEFSFTNRNDAIYTKDELLVADSGAPQQLPWEDWRPGEDLQTSGWMRATSSSGKADFVGQVAWSGELGYGVRSAEEPDEQSVSLVDYLRDSQSEKAKNPGGDRLQNVSTLTTGPNTGEVPLDVFELEEREFSQDDEEAN